MPCMLWAAVLSAAGWPASLLVRGRAVSTAASWAGATCAVDTRCIACDTGHVLSWLCILCLLPVPGSLMMLPVQLYSMPSAPYGETAVHIHHLALIVVNQADIPRQAISRKHAHLAQVQCSSMR